jgi:hypothetical protein
MTSRRIALNTSLAILALCGQGCRPQPPTKLFAGGPLPFGEDIYLSPANYGWSFPAKPGESYRVRADWPKGNVRLVVGSDHRGSARDEEDDASQALTAQGEPAGLHGQGASLVIGPEADTAFIELHTVGNGSGPMRLRIDRGP